MFISAKGIKLWACEPDTADWVWLPHTELWQKFWDSTALENSVTQEFWKGGISPLDHP